MNKLIRLLSQLSFKTVYFNWKYLPWKQAIRLPVLVSSHVRLLKMKGQIVIEAEVRPGMIQIGYGGVTIFDEKKSRSIWDVAGTVVFKGRCLIGHGSKVSVGEGARLIAGENLIITAETSLICSTELSFGSNCVLSWDILIMDTDFHTIRNQADEILNKPRPIRIGDKVWLGCRCTILKGAVIPSGSVVGAGATVTGILEQGNGLYVGTPARLSKQNINWEL